MTLWSMIRICLRRNRSHPVGGPKDPDGGRQYTSGCEWPDTRSIFVNLDMTRCILLLLFALAAIPPSLVAQKSTSYDLSTTKLTVSNRELTPFAESDKKGIRFSE